MNEIHSYSWQIVHKLCLQLFARSFCLFFLKLHELCAGNWIRGTRFEMAFCLNRNYFIGKINLAMIWEHIVFARVRMIFIAVCGPCVCTKAALVMVYTHYERQRFDQKVFATQMCSCRGKTGRVGHFFLVLNCCHTRHNSSDVTAETCFSYTLLNEIWHDKTTYVKTQNREHVLSLFY